MNRAETLKQIGEILDKRCNGCRIRDELFQRNGTAYSRTDGYCIRECEFGQQLQELGKQLTVRPRRIVEEADEHEAVRLA